jgi:hypothetical protein
MLLRATSSSVRLVSRAMLTGMRLMEVELRQYWYFCSSRASSSVRVVRCAMLTEMRLVELEHTSSYVFIRLHTSSYVSIREHTSAYVRSWSIHPHT